MNAAPKLAPLLVHRPKWPWRPRKRVSIQLTYRPSSLGALSYLPAELVFEILKHLDVPTMPYFRAVNYAAYVFVKKCLPYQRMMKCPLTKNSLVAMSMTKTLKLHTVEILDAAHRRPVKCAYCSEPGEFLLLTTAEPCCHGCLFPMAAGKDLARTSKDHFRSAHMGYKRVRNLPIVWWHRTRVGPMLVERGSGGENIYPILQVKWMRREGWLAFKV